MAKSSYELTKSRLAQSSNISVITLVTHDNAMDIVLTDALNYDVSMQLEIGLTILTSFKTIFCAVASIFCNKPTEIDITKQNKRNHNFST